MLWSICVLDVGSTLRSATHKVRLEVMPDIEDTAGPLELEVIPDIENTGGGGQSNARYIRYRGSPRGAGCT